MIHRKTFSTKYRSLTIHQKCLGTKMYKSTLKANILLEIISIIVGIYLQMFKIEIKKSANCPCKLCKAYIQLTRQDT